MKYGNACPGSTKLWKVPSTSPPFTFTTPISVIPAPNRGEPPEVSRSRTAKVVSESFLSATLDM